MPSTALDIRVSRREADRPRLLQARAFGEGAAGLLLRVEVDESGSLAGEALLRSRELVTAADGAALFQWYEWPRNGPPRDFVSVVTVTWEADGVAVYLEDLFE